MARNRNSTRIDLRYGGGEIDCLLNLATGEVERYAGDPRDFPCENEEARTDGIHSRLGGKQFYQSRSGCSGAGWIPAKPTLKKLGTYRVDIGGALIGFRFEHEFAPHVGDFEIYAPFSYRDGGTGGYPVVVRERDGKVTLLLEWQLVSFLRGEVETRPRSIEFTYLKDVNSAKEKLNTTVYLSSDEREQPDLQTTRRLAEGFSREKLEFVFPEGWQPEGDGEFWKRLGFRRFPGGLYKITRGICRFMTDEWGNVAKVQKWAPANVHMIAPHLYIQEWGGQYVGVARFEFEGCWYDYEIYLESERTFRVFAGNRDEIAKMEQELKEGAHAKYLHALQVAKRHEDDAREALKRNEDFRRLLEQYADFEVIIEDSIAAGNCRPGTDDFANRFFPGRTKVKVKELARFVTVWGVRRTLEHKFARVNLTTVLDAPQGEPDPLTRISGISPRLEQRLHDIGIYHFWQIADMSEVEAVHLAEVLDARGRVARDEWLQQAKWLLG